eukprot:4223966-Prymnesium_polylepis.1
MKSFSTALASGAMAKLKVLDMRGNPGDRATVKEACKARGIRCIELLSKQLSMPSRTTNDGFAISADGHYYSPQQQPSDQSSRQFAASV